MHKSTRPGITLNLLLAAALLLRALIPAGFMPGQSGGAPALVLCTAQGARVVAGDPGAHHSTHAQCPFALAVGLAALPPAGLPALQFFSGAEILSSAMAQPQRRSSSGFLARGPPVLV